jgi:hypothetical protein
MTAPGPPSLPKAPQRLLVVVTRDFGELGSAIGLLAGLGGGFSGRVLLPLDLPEPDISLPGLSWGRYASRADIERAFDELGAQRVVCLSAYLLLGTAPGLGLWGIVRLLRHFERGGARVDTSDPFLTLLRRPWTLQLASLVRAHLGDGPPSWRVRIVAAALAWRLWLLVPALRRCRHLYPAPIHPVRPPPRLRWAQYATALPPPPPRDPGLWMFVLARIDHDVLRQQLGPALVARVAARLGEALDSGARVLLVAPAALLGPLRERLPAAARARCELCETLPLSRYLQSLRAAHHAFFWNRYSFSIVFRVLDGRPVFFFGAGHVEHMLPAMSTAGPRCFYAGWTPPLLGPDEPLAPAALEAAAQAMREPLAAAALVLAAGAPAAELFVSE